MIRHRRDEAEADTKLLPVTLLPETVEQLAAAERAAQRGRPRFEWLERLQRLLRRRLVIPAVVCAVLVAGGAGAWVLSGRSDPLRLFPAPGDGTRSTTGSGVTDGFGEAPSPQASASLAASRGTGPRPSTSPAPGAGSGVAQTPEPPVAQAQMLAHYRFDEESGATAADASGGGRTATLSGGVSFVSGRAGNAAALSGSTQYVSMPSGILDGAQGFTFAAWVRLDTAATWARVFDFGTGQSVNMFLTVRSDAGTARFAITTGGNTKEQCINAPAALPTGAWTHVAVTLSGGVGILYVNRAEVARTTGMTLTPASLGGSTSRNWIGRSQYGADPYLDGSVDDVRLYARALPASEIAALP